ncbi:MAG: hypothetical protein SOY65_04820 [Marinifilaceae bacterium]|nr:hypothetical protein [Marinifilaceae bacterium]
MQKINKYLNILTIVMLVITAVLIVLFFAGGELPNQAYSTPVYTEQLLYWSYFLFAACAIAALAFPIVRLFTRPKQAVKALAAVGLLAIIVLIAYAMADGTPLKISGYTGPDNVPSRLILTDTLIYTTYFLGIIAIGAIIVTEIIRRVR